MMEPFYIRQTAEPMSPVDRNDWASRCMDEARDQGAKLCRFSIHQRHPNLFLVEAWNAPAHEVGDQGEPRWQLTKSD